MKNDMTVYTVRIPRSLREKMKKINIKWSEEIRKFIENKVRHETYRMAMESIEKVNLKFVHRRTVKPSWMLIREDRER